MTSIVLFDTFWEAIVVSGPSIVLLHSGESSRPGVVILRRAPTAQPTQIAKSIQRIPTGPRQQRHSRVCSWCVQEEIKMTYKCL